MTVDFNFEQTAGSWRALQKKSGSLYFIAGGNISPQNLAGQVLLAAAIYNGRRSVEIATINTTNRLIETTPRSVSRTAGSNLTIWTSLSLPRSRSQAGRATEGKAWPASV